MVIPATASTKTITLTPQDGGLAENIETAVLTVIPNDGVPTCTVGSPSVAVGTILGDDDGPLPALPAEECGCDGGADKVQQEGGLTGNNPGGLSTGGVRLTDGTLRLNTTDLGSGGFGTGWGMSRSWTNGPGYAGGSSAGSGQVVSDLPYLKEDSAGTVMAISDGATARFFDNTLDYGKNGVSS